MNKINNHGSKKTSLKQRVLPPLTLLILTIGVPLALYPGQEQKLQSPLVDVVHAQEPIVVKKPLTIDQMIDNAFGKDAPLMKKIIKCESGGNPNAKNKSSSATGLFQIMASVHGQTQEALKDPLYNIWYAQKLFLEQGTTPWISSKSCWSK